MQLVVLILGSIHFSAFLKTKEFLTFYERFLQTNEIMSVFSRTQFTAFSETAPEYLVMISSLNHLHPVCLQMCLSIPFIQIPDSLR